LATSWEGLFGRLEDHPDLAGERLETRQRQGDPNPYGGVGVVAAGVHDGWDFGTELEALGLLNRQRIEIGPEAHSGMARTYLDGETGPRSPGARAQAVASQSLNYQFSGLVLRIGEFGMAMDGASQAHDSG
jgi:hypothetical protein